MCETLKVIHQSYPFDATLTVSLTTTTCFCLLALVSVTTELRLIFNVLVI